MPNYQTLKNTGLFLTQDHLTDGPGIRNARKLLQETAKTFAKQSASFYDIVGEFPFIYRERQLHSVLFPSLVKVSDAAFYKSVKGKG